MNQALTLLFFASLIIIILSILLYFKPKKWKMFIIIYGLIIFIVSYLYIPQSYTDLYRYFQLLDLCKNTSFSNASYQLNNFYNDNLFIRNILFWVVANYANYHILPALTTTSVFYIGAYVIGDYAQRIKRLQLIAPMLLCEYLQLPLFGIMVNIRNVFAFSLIILAAYRDCVQHKRNINTLLLYILPCFLHTSAFLLVIFRFIAPLVKKLKYIIPLILLFIPEIINLSYMYLDRLPSFLNSAVLKAYGYLKNDIATDWGNTVINSRFFKVQRFAMILIAIIVIILIYIAKISLSKSIESFVFFNLLIWVATIGCNIFTSPHYWRFFSAGILSMNVLIANFSSVYKSLSVVVKILIATLYMSSLFMFILNVWSTSISY